MTRDRLIRCRLHGPLWLVAGVFAVMGCGGDSYRSDRPDVVPASGVLTHAGQPVEGATITFNPKQSGMPPAYAKTGSAGRFMLQTFDANDGAVPGEYTVTVTLYENVQIELPPEADPDHPDYDPSKVPAPVPAKSLVPERYGNVRTSDLTATVTAGEQNEFPFDLKD